MVTEPVRLLLADDQALVRGAMSALLDLEDDLTVVAEASTGAEAAARARELRPDVCLMDIQMPGMDGIAATRLVLDASPSTRVLIVTTFARPGYVREALEAGASGLLAKDVPAAQLAHAVRRVHGGLRVVDPALAEASLFEGANPLSEREQEVLRLSDDGSTIAHIAAEIYLSAGTVRNILSSAIGKTGTQNRAQAARVARDKGWI